MESTAGAYLGKYLSATFGLLLDATESFDQPDDQKRGSFTEKAATWKLALYWATNRRFWSGSESITVGIRLQQHIEDSDVYETVRWCIMDSVELALKCPVKEDISRDFEGNQTELCTAVDRALSTIEYILSSPLLPEDSIFCRVIDYIGAFAYWDLPSHEVLLISSDVLMKNWISDLHC